MLKLIYNHKTILPTYTPASPVLHDKGENTLRMQSVRGFREAIYGLLRSRSGSSSNPYQYSGERMDLETGLQYLRARYYNPKIGRFISRDDYEGEVTSPATLNRYLYGKGNAVKWVDPSGRMSLVEMMVTQAISSYLMTMSMPYISYFSDFIGKLMGIPKRKDWGNIDATIFGMQITIGHLNYGMGAGFELLVGMGNSILRILNYDI